MDLAVGSRSAHGVNDVGEVAILDSPSFDHDGVSVDVTLVIKFSAQDQWLLVETCLAVAEALEEIPPLALMTWGGIPITHRDAAFFCYLVV